MGVEELAAIMDELIRSYTFRPGNWTTSLRMWGK